MEGPSRFWMLLFDRLKMPSAEPLDSQSPAVATAMERLEVQSAFFEQFLIQNVGTTADLSDYFGGVGRCDAFRQRLSESGRVLRQVNVAADVDSPLVKECQSRLQFPGLSSKDTGTLTVSSFESPSAEDLQLICGADVLVISVVQPERDSEFVERILTAVQALAATLFPEESEPALLVTAFRGVHCPAPSPLEYGLDEGLLQVPAWYRHSKLAPGRFQTVCGSFDLLPSILGILKKGSEEVVETEHLSAEGVEPGFSGTRQLFTAELLDIVNSDRMLRLKGDGWTGLRTQQYLLVVKAPSEKEGFAAEELLLQLYLKPDDYWNVNNVIVSYGEIARLMLEASENAEDGAGPSDVDAQG